MLKFQILTDQDRKEAAAIARRRRIEDERRGRIFNARNRLIGVDKQVLAQQIAEKKTMRDEQRRTEAEFDAQMLKDNQVAQLMEKREHEERRKLEEEINRFRKTYQRSENRREFDLNDPNVLKKSLPARLLDDDPRLGPSSAQKFEGEDLSNDDRNKIQREQFRAWLEQQMDERRSAEKEQKAAEDAYQAALVARDNRATELSKLEADCRRRLDEATVRFNRALAAEQRSRRMMEDKMELEDKQAEMYNNMVSDMMTENPAVAQSNLGSSRQIGYLYKGMTREEQEVVRKEQALQRKENEKRRIAEARYNEEWNQFMNVTSRSAELVERELTRKQKALNMQLAEENKELSKEQKSRKQYLEKIVYKNVPTAAFYEQFNQTTR